MGAPALLGAQGAALRYNVLYACPDPLRLMVLSCTGEDPSATCETQGYNRKQPTRRRPVPRTQVNAMLQMCHVQTRAEAEADASAGPAMNGGDGASGQTESNGIKVGDQVEVVTGFGWTPAKVLAISGNSYRVLANGVQVTKDYPNEVRRVGGLTLLHQPGKDNLDMPIDINDDGTLQTPLGEIKKKGS